MPEFSKKINEIIIKPVKRDMKAGCVERKCINRIVLQHPSWIETEKEHHTEEKDFKQKQIEGLIRAATKQPQSKPVSHEPNGGWGWKNCTFNYKDADAADLGEKEKQKKQRAPEVSAE